MEPRWKIVHDYWMEDITFEIEQQEKIKAMLRKHPDDEMGDAFRSILKNLEKRYGKMIRAYKKIYGGNPPGLIKLRRDISEREY